MTKDEIRDELVKELLRGLKEITADLGILRSRVDRSGSETWVTLSEKLRAEERRKLTMLERLANGELPDDETAWDKIRKS
jgi:hypothetical protein